MITLPLAYVFAAAAPAAVVPSYVPAVLERWEGSGISVKVEAKQCGFDNALYTFKTKTVTLCSDLFDRPALTRFILNHELAHAFMHQHDIPWLDAEFAADELGFFMSEDDEVYAAAIWFMQDGGTEESADGHPSDLDRAGTLLCLQAAHESEDAPNACRFLYRSALGNWIRWFKFEY